MNKEYSDEFRRIQEESQGMSIDDIQRFHRDGGGFDERTRQLLSDTFGKELKSASDSLQYVEGTIVNPATQRTILR